MKRIRVFVSIGILLIFWMVCLSFAADYKYVGSKTSNKYHYTDCEWAKTILAKKLITFKTVEEAVNAKYVPCKVCKPPMPKD